MNVIINHGQITAISPSCNSAEVVNGMLRFSGPCITDARYLASIAVPEGYESGMHLIRMADAVITAGVEAHIEGLYAAAEAMEADIADMQAALAVLNIVPEEGGDESNG